MTYRQAAPTRTRRIPSVLVAGLLVVSAAIGAALGYQLQAFSSSAAASPIDAVRSERPRPQLPPPRAVAEAAPPIDAPRSQLPWRQLPPPRAAGEAAAPGGADPRDRPQRGASGVADGVVPDGTTVIDSQI